MTTYHGEDTLEIGQAEFGPHLVRVWCPPDSAFSDGGAVEVVPTDSALYVLVARRILESYLAAYGDALTAHYAAVRDIGSYLASRYGWAAPFLG